MFKCTQHKRLMTKWDSTLMRWRCPVPKCPSFVTDEYLRRAKRAKENR